MEAIRTEKVSARISRMQNHFSQYATLGALVSDDLIADRRKEVERDASESIGHASVDR